MLVDMKMSTKERITCNDLKRDRGFSDWKVYFIYATVSPGQYKLEEHAHHGQEGQGSWWRVKIHTIMASRRPGSAIGFTMSTTRQFRTRVGFSSPEEGAKGDIQQTLRFIVTWTGGSAPAEKTPRRELSLYSAPRGRRAEDD